GLFVCRSTALRRRALRPQLKRDPLGGSTAHMPGSSWRTTKVRPPPRPPITEPSKLREYSDEHLAYEVEMLWLAATHPPPDPNTAQDAKTRFVSNAQAEAFALHLRNLIVFLYPDRFPLKDDDV